MTVAQKTVQISVEASPSKRLPLFCSACKANNKPVLVFLKDGCLVLRGNGIRISLTRKVIMGRCPWCNREWEYHLVT